MYLFMKASRVVLRGVRSREEPLTYYVFKNSLGNEIWSIYNAKYWGNPPVHIISYLSWSRLHDKWGDLPRRVAWSAR